MTGCIWRDFMMRYNAFLSSQNRKVLLIVDNFSGHKIDAELPNIEMTFLKPNLTSRLQPADLLVISTLKKRYKKWYNLQILDEKELSHGQVISKFGQLQSQLEPEIGLKAWIKSGLIEHYDGQPDQPDEDLIIDDQTPSQHVTNELLTMNLNDSQTECTESITKSQNLKQSSISCYFQKK